MSVARVMPVQKPGRSVQEVGTPSVFLGAVEARFGKLAWDLAANESNHVTAGWFGPGSPWPDALATVWWDIDGLLWLNPPYANMGEWAEKCARESSVPLDASLARQRRARIAFLVPASVGTNWWARHVDGKAAVKFLSPRLTFVGHTQSYPKDLALCLYGDAPGYECWRWKP